MYMSFMPSISPAIAVHMAISFLLEGIGAALEI
jgi:hypothetical protein